MSLLLLFTPLLPPLPAADCTGVPPLSYMPWDVGWAAVLLCAVDILAGVAGVGLLGSALKWTADDPAPLRALWIVLILVGFITSAGGLYLGLANQAHVRAVHLWLSQSSAACIAEMSRSPNLYASSVSGSIELGGAALALIVLGISGALIERRRARSRPTE